MSTYVALLRGINVSGRNKIAMSDLRDLFEALGHTGIRTYVQSGNVVFDAKAAPAHRLEAAIQKRIADALGLEVGVLLRTRRELAMVSKRNPFGAHAYVTFLDHVPGRALVTAIDSARYTPDEFTVHGREVFVRCPNGYGRTKINNAFFERKLAAQATTRNWKTVTALCEWTGD